MADGTITIGTELSTDKFDRQIMKLEKKMQEAEQKDIKITVQEQEIRQTIANYEALRDEVVKTTVDIEKLKNISPGEIGVKTSDYLTLLNEMQDRYKGMSAELQQQTNGYMKARQQLDQMEDKHRQLTGQVREYKRQIASINLRKQQKDTEQLRKNFDNVGKTIQKTIGRVGKLALGIFGIRSAFMFLRRAASDLASYDPEFAANLDYIKYVLTQTIAPVLRWIVQLAGTLLNYIYAILNAWFGIGKNIDVSVESFKQMQKNASGTGKAVKDLKKQLAGFDEINMLTDQDSGGAGGVPTIDIGSIQGEVPKWLQWIFDNGDIILSVIGGIVGGFKSLKALNLLKDLGLIEGTLNGIKALGIGTIITGVIYALQNLFEYLDNPSWDSFGDIFVGIGIAIIGLGVVVLGLPGIIAGVVVAIVGLVIKYWEQIKSFLQDKINWLTDQSDWVRNTFGDTVGDIYDNIVNHIQKVLDWLDKGFTGMRYNFDQLIDFFKNVFAGNWEAAWQNIKNIFNNNLNFIKDTLKFAFESVKTFLGNMATAAGQVISNAFKAVINAVLARAEWVLNSPIRAINNLVDTINNIPGINLGRLSTFSLPRLKSGAILNMPNKGTLVGGGSALAGEAGQEGIIPLTDSQAMETLGEAIGRYITINANIVNKMNGRILSRELTKIKQEEDFAFNL